MTDHPHRRVCAECGRPALLIPHGICERCKQELRVENRGEYYEALSWEWEYRERKWEK